MHVKNSFEEEFGTHMWRKHTGKVASMKSKSVVALASFNGDYTVTSFFFFGFYLITS